MVGLMPDQSKSWERRQQRIVIRQIRITLLRLLVEHAEQIAQARAGCLHVELGHIIPEQILAAEHTGILRIQTKDDAHAEFVEAFEDLRVIRVLILL